MKIRLLLLMIVCVAASCNLQYDGETRLVFESTITNSQGNPISGQPVSIEIIPNNDGSGSDLISNTYTDDFGKALLIFPAAESKSTISINTGDHPVYQRKSFVNITQDDFKDYKLSLPIKLYRKDEITNLYLTLDQTSTNTAIKELTIDALKPEEIVDFHPEPLNYIYYEMNIQVIKHQQVVLHYSVRDSNTIPSVITEYTEVIQIDDEPVEFTISY